MGFMENLKEFFKSKGIGFYLVAAASLLAFVQFIIYIVAFTNIEYRNYMHWSVIFFAVLAIAGGIALSVFRKTANYAPIAFTVCELLSFLFFIRFGYMYFSTQFFGGVTVELIFGMYFGYLWSIILYVVALIVGNVAIYMKKLRTQESAEVKA